MPALPRIIDAVSPGDVVLVRRYLGGAPSKRFEPARVLSHDYGALRVPLAGGEAEGARLQVQWLYDELTETVDWHFGFARELTPAWLNAAYLQAVAERATCERLVEQLSKLKQKV